MSFLNHIWSFARKLEKGLLLYETRKRLIVVCLAVLQWWCDLLGKFQLPFVAHFFKWETYINKKRDLCLRTFSHWIKQSATNLATASIIFSEKKICEVESCWFSKAVKSSFCIWLTYKFGVLTICFLIRLLSFSYIFYNKRFSNIIFHILSPLLSSFLFWN